MTRSFNAELGESHGLTVSDVEVLKQLSAAPDGHMRRTDLAERVRLTPSGITRLLDGLQRAGLVYKASCPTDARVTYACLTDDGRATLGEAEAGFFAALGRLFAERYAPEELERLADLLGRLPGAGAGLEEMCPGGPGAEGAGSSQPPLTPVRTSD